MVKYVQVQYLQIYKNIILLIYVNFTFLYDIQEHALNYTTQLVKLYFETARVLRVWKQIPLQSVT